MTSTSVDVATLIKRLRANGNKGAKPLGNGCFADLADEAADKLASVEAERDELKRKNHILADREEAVRLYNEGLKDYGDV